MGQNMNESNRGVALGCLGFFVPGSLGMWWEAQRSRYFAENWKSWPQNEIPNFGKETSDLEVAHLAKGVAMLIAIPFIFAANESVAVGLIAAGVLDTVGMFVIRTQVIDPMDKYLE